MEVKLDTIGIEFSFDAKMTGSNKTRFYRELYGWKNFSNFGRYIYIKDGLLSNIKHIKPTKSTIIVSIKNSKIVRDFFKKNKVVFNEKIIVLNKEEAKKLGFRFDSEWEKIYEEIKGNENLTFKINV